MCGIIGFKGSEEAAPIILEGLRKLEYRGYDSAGIVTFGSRFHLQKDVGKLDEIKFNLEELKGNLGCGHTRWATTGAVTMENSHPHLSSNKKIAVVHNGIIENYQELKEFLISRGLSFYSQTDTEVIPNLIEYFMREKDFFEATRLALSRLDGSYAIIALNNEENRLVAARKD